MNNKQLFNYLTGFKPYHCDITVLGGIGEMEKSIIKDSIKVITNQYSTKSNSTSSTIIYVTNNKQYDRLRELLGLTGDSEEIPHLETDDDYARIALLFPNVNSILIPKKAKRNLNKYVPRPLLRAIDPNLNVAIEKCLVFLSYLSPTYYMENKWKPLNSIRLHEQLKDKTNNTFTYKAIIDALKHGTKQTGPIIEVMTDDNGVESYEVGVTPKQYRLTDTYLKAGLEEYILKDESIIQQRNKTFYKALFETQNNTITNNLVSVYQQIDLPTLDEVLTKGKRLAKAGQLTKKGKTLTMRNKHKDDYWRDAKERSFVEENIELFKFLTGRGFMIPVIGKNTSGGRVVDSFNLMPSWIRAMVKIKEEPIVECDFKAMHPNLASKLFNGTGQFISHELVADYLGVEKSVAKKEHLSFFNKPYYPTKEHPEKGSMVNSPIFNFYSDNESSMLDNIRREKLNYGYKTATYKLFKLEVELMTEIIRRLNEQGIYVLYVYDALYCAKSDYNIVKKTMNDVAIEFGIKTMVD